MCEIRIQQDFIIKKNIKIEQSYDKKTYPKLMLNKLKVMKSSIFIYIHWAPNSNKFFKKILIHMWPMFTHMC